MKTNVRNLTSLFLLSAAFLAFGAFHFLQSFDQTGWEIWKEVWSLALDPSELADPLTAIAVASFLMFAVLIVSSPFLISVFPKSRIAWWMAAGSSGLAAVGFWMIVFQGEGPKNLGPGGWCLLFAPWLNFAGLLAARDAKATAR